MHEGPWTLQRARANWREAAVPGCHSPVPSRGGLSCGVCSGSRTEQRKPGKDLQLHHLTRYELGDGDGDDLGRTVDVGYHAARFGSAEAAIAGSVGSVQSCMPRSATRSAVVVAGSISRSSWSP